ncbi:FG-GAP-like repeat-containing protein [Dyadobacter fermentans]|uniref:FG-GAP-like repeat-containing protein n=1 Tax=Dyadobacter fermentans TaxID=94254 RepID=UPI001CBC8404|nr:FG-GAP-like repeat-containing protein [Dyadobacter fermentans]MBZ1362385.1 VCBS repeat-containing protein [Dyadobacter fermentans]
MKLSKWLPALPAGIFIAAVCIQACGTSGRPGEAGLTGEMAEGRDAARKHCSSCHLPVDPALLDKDTWKNRVLPVMAQYFGIEVWQRNQYFASENSAMPITDWMKIVAYYDSLAPVHLPGASVTTPVRKEWAGFTLKKPADDTSHLATTTMVAIDSAGQSIYTSSSEMPALVRWDPNFSKKSKAPLTSPAMHMLFTSGQPASGQPIVTAVGEMRAYDVTRGELYRVETSGLGSVPFINGLRRPLQTSAADFNRDGKTDYVVSAFGHNQGGLYIFKQMQGGKFEKAAVREVPGATQSVTGDFNADGWPDIIALFAHAQEGIWLFTNDQKGGFTEKELLRFPPVYGSSSFQLADFNADGKPDILYTAGDNSDYSRILKPYHGIYIFLNKGDFQFEQKWFYPANGATKAMAADFDGDGDLDIASIAFFADLIHNPGEKFLYFQNESAKSALKFQPFSPPIAQYGRWICMDVKDWDGDGDPDVVLGNYSRGFLNQDDVKADWNVYLPFLVLQNDLNSAAKHSF